MRLIPVAVAALALAGLAGCSSSDSASGPTFVASASPSVNPAAADAKLSKDTTAICSQASRAATEFGKKFVADLKDQSDAKDQGSAAQAAAKQHLTQDVQSYSGALKSMAALADDAKLKKALQQMSKEVTKLTGDLSKLSPSAVSKIASNLDTACGKG